METLVSEKQHFLAVKLSCFLEQRQKGSSKVAFPEFFKLSKT